MRPLKAPRGLVLFFIWIFFLLLAENSFGPSCVSPGPMPSTQPAFGRGLLRAVTFQPLAQRPALSVARDGTRLSGFYPANW